MNEEEKKAIIQEVNLRVGSDIRELKDAYNFESELKSRRKELLSCLNAANNEVPTKLSAALKKAELNSKQVDELRTKSEQLKSKVQTFLKTTEPLIVELGKRFSVINKLEHVQSYLKSFEKVEDLSRQLKQGNDDEQLVLLYGELKHMCSLYKKGHRATYVKDYTHYWHNVLKDKLTKHYEDVLKQLKWPFAVGVENSPPAKEIMVKFSNLTRYLFLIQEPEELSTPTVSGDFDQEIHPCLPVKLLLRPIKKRFTFHFTGPRQTARIDRPEWFLTQTLTWIKDHQGFIRNHVQAVADKLELKNVMAVDEFNSGLAALAAERLHTVLALYLSHGSKGEIGDVDAAFAHAVDETLGYNRELIAVTGNEANSALTVLTKAETFVRWLAVEKKYALAKMDEMLGSEQWSEAVAAGVGAATGDVVWVPRAAHWFISLLKTIEDRYAELPQPGHRLQFLELQLELVEEWRVRLTQLLSASLESLQADSFLSPGPSSHPLAAIINAAHHTRITLLQWAHSLHYLQLYYYRRQFQQFTQQQHHDEESDSSSSSDDESEEEVVKPSKDCDTDGALSLKEVEVRANELAIVDLSRKSSLVFEEAQFDITSPIANLAVTEPLPDDDDAEEAGVFAEGPALLARLRDAGLSALAQHILLEFKAGLGEYKKQKWHGLVIVEESALCVSGALCAPLSGLCARLAAAGTRLAPPLTARLRAHLAEIVDQYIYEQVVLEGWFNTGGATQFIHDVKRNLVPAFAPPNKNSVQRNQLPRLLESCKLLNMDYEEARRLRNHISREPKKAAASLAKIGIRHIPPKDAQRILNQRTDLNDTRTPPVLELF